MLERTSNFKKGKYSIHSKKYISVEKSIKEYQNIIKRYHVKSIEDPFAENDWLAWNKLMKSIKRVQIVGDDLYVTNLERLKKGFLNISSNLSVYLQKLSHSFSFLSGDDNIATVKSPTSCAA